MEYYPCENADCGCRAEGSEPAICPDCSGTFFLPVERKYISITSLADQYVENHDYEGYRFNSLQQVFFGEHCHGKLPDFSNHWAEELQDVCQEKGPP